MLRNIVYSASAPRLTTHEPHERQQAATDGSESLDGDQGVLRTRGVVFAPRRKTRRNDTLIPANGFDCHRFPLLLLRPAHHSDFIHSPLNRPYGVRKGNHRPRPCRALSPLRHDAVPWAAMPERRFFEKACRPAHPGIGRMPAPPMAWRAKRYRTQQEAKLHVCEQERENDV